MIDVAEGQHIEHHGEVTLYVLSCRHKDQDDGDCYRGFPCSQVCHFEVILPSCSDEMGGGAICGGGSSFAAVSLLVQTNFLIYTQPICNVNIAMLFIAWHHVYASLQANICQWLSHHIAWYHMSQVVGCNVRSVCNILSLTCWTYGGWFGTVQNIFKCNPRQQH